MRLRRASFNLVVERATLIYSDGWHLQELEERMTKYILPCKESQRDLKYWHHKEL
jgi:hypothetical protein